MNVSNSNEERERHSSGRIQKAFSLLLKVLPTVVCVFFLIILYNIIRSYNFQDIAREVRASETRRIALAIAFTFINYFVLTFYDAIVLQLLGRKVDSAYMALTAFLSYAFSNTLGFSVLSGGAVRYRFYSLIGLSAAEVAQILAFNAIHFWMGLFLLAGLTCVLDPSSASLAFSLERHHSYLVGFSFLLPIIAYLFMTTIRKAPVRVMGWEIPVPPLGTTLTGLLIASVDWFLAGATIYLLLPPTQSFQLWEVLSAFLIAMSAGVLTHAPGGIGVFETIMIMALRDVYTGAGIISALILFRGIYYLLPFAVAVLLFGWHELRLRSKIIRIIFERQFRAMEILFSVVVPPLLAISTFVGGAILLFSGATPTAADRLWWVHTAPLFVIETSHFVNSVTGVGLLVLAWSMFKRIDAAYKMTLILLELGIVVSLAKGFDYEEALYLGLLMLVLLPCRRYFYRKASLFSRLTPGIVLAILLVFGSTLYLGFFSYREVEYAHHLWWQFSFDDDAPRFLRGTVIVMLIAFALGLRRALKPARPEVSVPRAQDYDDVETCLKFSDRTSQNLALLGDKYFLFNEDRSGFVMFRSQGRSWVALGDPVGKNEVRRDLIWMYREFCDAHDGWCVFYQVSAAELPHYIEVGLRLYKLGEEAILPLNRFSLSGPTFKSFRSASRRLEKEGFRFEVVPSVSVPAILPELRAISDDWISSKSTREKGFSVGFFNEEYLKRFPVATVLKDGKIYGFANIWQSGTKKEISVDLMRYTQDSPNGIMDYLFTQLMIWGREHEYQRFNLGMAPLSGLENRPLAPLWNRAGALIYTFGESFYNFEGLYRYKDKFSPIWEPKYLASNVEVMLPRVLTNLATLIAQGPADILPSIEK